MKGTIRIDATQQHRLYGILLVVLALAWATQGSPLQDADAQGEASESGAEGVWKTYRYVDGLASNWVRALLQDKEGAIWFAAFGGVSRFDGKSWKTFTQKDGLASDGVLSILQDKEGAIWFGTGGFAAFMGSGVSRYDGKSWKTYTQNDGLASNTVYAILQDREGAIWIGTESNGVSRYDGKSWKTYTQNDGLASNTVYAIIQDKEGAIWIGTYGGGVSRFDGKSWKTYTQKDGLAGNVVWSIMQDKEGVMWFGTLGSGVSRYDGKSWKTYTQGDGLALNAFGPILQDKGGAIWVGTGLSGGPPERGGVSRYDGKSWKTYTQKDGLASNYVPAIIQDKEGAIWFGTESGVSRYDGKSWKTYTQNDGLVSNGVAAILQDKEGVMWFGTMGGISRYDGKSWKTYTQKDGLANNFVRAIIQDKEGAIWFGTMGGGVSRYDGKSWKTYTQKDGLVNNFVQAILQDKEGTFWFGTLSGGVSRFDGRCFQTIDSRDGLANDNVTCLYEDKSGQIWIGTFGGGVVRFNPPNKVPPPVYITQMIADKTYDNPRGTIQLRSGIPRISVSYHAISFKTRPGAMKYFYQLVSKTSEVLKTSEVWQGPTNEETVEYFNLKPGEYTFKVQAVDRDLNYSEPASMSIIIPPPPFYQTGIFLMALSITGGVLLLGIIILGIQRWRSTNAENLRLQQELEDAHRMQIRLLPESAPTVEGFEIAGFCRPAREVGGDFFDYLLLASGKIGLALADVSGKGLKGAMNAVLASGMLHEVAKIETSCGKILSALNADLHPRMEKQMFTALGLAILDHDGKTLQWANAAQPYPIVKQGEQVFEFERDGGLPLSIMPNVSYPDWELELQAGDIVIFYTDGIIEAENESEEMYGTERLKQAVAHIDSTMNAEEMIKTILQDVALFVGTAEQYDDMTVVVVKKV